MVHKRLQTINVYLTLTLIWPWLI